MTDYNLISFSSFGFVLKPSTSLTQILTQHNLTKPVYILENSGNNKYIKKTSHR